MVTQTRSKQPSKTSTKSTHKTTANKATQKKSKAAPSTHKKVNNKVANNKIVTTKPVNKAKVKQVKPKSVESKSTLNDNVMPYKFEPYQSLKGESYMSDRQLQHFRNILETWKKELKKEVDNTITEMKGASVLADPSDRATEEEIFAFKLRTRDRERKLIHKIEEALQLIDDKEYGYCESCGVEIGIRRLEARPTAFLCIDCKTLDEIRERNIQ